MSKVSIIVPVYNNEKYIAACVESILGQSHSDLQVILVNDGSTDKSGEICDSYAAADNRVVVIHKPNSGVSDTRNAGLAIADGEYIAFVDSDDTVHANFIELLLKNIQGHDMSIGGVQQNFLNENRSHILEVKNKVFSISDFKKHMKITICSQYINPNWNKMFKTEIVKSNNIMFRTDMNVSEDCVFNLTYLDKCKTIKAFSDVIYYYNVRTDYTRSESYKKAVSMTVSKCARFWKHFILQTPHIFTKEFCQSICL